MVRQKIKNLKINFAPGLDNIEVRLLKHCINSFSSPLAKIMSNLQKGDKLSADNYRPISLVSVVSKIMESIIVD